MLKLTKKVILIAFLTSVAVSSCEKKVDIPTDDTTGTINAERIKFQKMERFISIMWQVPLNKVLFDKNKNEFSFDEVRISKYEIEKLYDVSNEYKLKYENN